VKREWRGTYKGQKQIWFLLRLVGREAPGVDKRTAQGSTADS
jgi:putative (di)nucleoside polyphosphate hydrolase